MKKAIETNYISEAIYPYEEFERRLNALKEYLAYLNDDSLKLIVDAYDQEEYLKIAAPYKDEKEGGHRCYLCYTMRMEHAFNYAARHHYDYCTTVMSISSRKNSDWLNEIGEKLADKYGVSYLHADFKKGDGITENERLNRRLGLYHQNYCGCIYSLR